MKSLLFFRKQTSETTYLSKPQSTQAHEPAEYTAKGRIGPFLLSFLTVFSGTTFSLTFDLPTMETNLVGETISITLQPGDGFNSIARSHDIGFTELLMANPGIDRFNLKAGRELIIPSQFLLPPGPREGIVVNLAEMRLYYYPQAESTVMTFPLAIGREGWRTPHLISVVQEKRVRPTWYPPASIRAYRASRGIYLPTFVPPGPENPLGEYAMRVGWTNVLIHGTNQPAGIGREASSGCLRMYPEDIETLFRLAPIGTPVRIMDKPYKVGWQNGELYLEAHKSLSGQWSAAGLDTEIKTLLVNAAAEQGEIEDWDEVKTILKQKTGIPIPLSFQRKNGWMARSG